MKSTKSFAGWAGLAAGAAVLSILLFRKREDGTTLGAELLGRARDAGEKLRKYGSELKDRLLHNVKGPNGEDVYVDMYDRQFYEDATGHRIYLETNS